MPSSSLQIWRNDRLVRFAEVEKQCAATLALDPPNPMLRDENLRGLILLLSAQFQGFCRDLHTECTAVLFRRVEQSRIGVLFQNLCLANRGLDRGNPNLQNIREDFERFGFRLDLPAADPAHNPMRLTHLDRLNKFRNVVAHDGRLPSEGLPDLSTVLVWKESCQGLATSIDDVMYHRLREILGEKPWEL